MSTTTLSSRRSKKSWHHANPIQKAHHVVREISIAPIIEEQINLSVADQTLLISTLLNPPAANEALQKAFAHHQRLVQKY
uniref:Uncharacterized protein n=1 Tax=Chlorobium chlorochromatii (strain CaD3) TaxID=340177 RepID=Q3AR42_CHLCH